MKPYVELKLTSDAYGGGYAGGLTLCGSQSTNELVEIEKNKFTNKHGHTVILNENYRSDADVTEYSTTFINTSNQEAVLELLTSFALKEIECDKVHRMQTYWSAEGRLKTETMIDLYLEPSWSGNGLGVEKFGSIGSMPIRKYFPFIVLENSKTGEFVGAQLYLASSWQMELLCWGNGAIMLTGGIADRDFGHWMKKIAPGESFTTPKAVVAKGHSLLEVCNKLVSAQNPDISECDRDMSIIFNEYCTTWGNPSTENIKKCVDKLDGKDIKFFVIDTGWYGNGKPWYMSKGDWEVDKNKFPNGLKEATDYIRSHGMIPGLWFEFEVCSAETKAFALKEHMLKIDGAPFRVWDTCFWDMTDPWVVNMLTEKVIKQLKDNGFGYIKVDYNTPIGIGADGAESLGEKLRQCVEATQLFFKKIKQEIPDIVIENCASGGHRLEPSMMELCSQASFSDAHETKSMPIIAANLHRVIKPSQEQIWAVLRAGDDEDRLNYTLVNTFFGRMCLSGDIYDLSDEQWDIVNRAMKFYKEASDIIKNGHTVYIKNNVVTYTKPNGEQLVIREWGNKQLVIAHRFENSSAIDESFADGKKIIAEFGKVDNDFSAKAWILEK